MNSQTFSPSGELGYPLYRDAWAYKYFVGMQGFKSMRDAIECVDTIRKNGGQASIEVVA